MNIRYPIYEGVYRILTVFLENYALQEEEFARNTFQSGRLRHDDRPLRPTNPDDIAKQKEALGRRYKGIDRMCIKGM